MTGVATLVRLVLRRDRLLLPLWTVLLGALPAAYVSSFTGLFPTAADRLRYAQLSSANPGFTALYGPLRGSSLGELVAWRSGFLPVLVGLFALLTVVRHTRADEEAGRTELVGAAVAARRAGLYAALLVTAAAGLLTGLVPAAAMIGQGLPVTGSLAFGAQFTLAAWTFAAVGALAAQLTTAARAARGLAAAVLAAAFALRLAGDVSAAGGGPFGWLAWLSPIGWVQHILPYGADDPRPALLALAGAVAVTALAVRLAGRRDLGAGLLPERPGRAAAAPALRSPLALAARLHRGPLAGWLAGAALLGLVFGAVGDSVVDLVGGDGALNDVFTRLGGSAAVVDAYFAVSAGVVGLVAACQAVQAVLRMHDEEAAGHAEAVLGTGVGRLGWAAGHLAFALLGPALTLAVEGVAAGLAYGAATGDAGRLPAVLAAALVQLPAVWVLAALAVALFGLLPRLAPAAWAAPAGCLALLLLGGVLRLDQRILDLSPFTHVPRVPGGPVAVLPLAVLAVVAAALGAAGLAGLRRRDVPA